MAICDANYCFTMFDVGQFVSNNDSRVLANSTMGVAFESERLKVPKGRVIDQETGILPYFLVGDEIFPLKTWLIRPYPGTDLSCDEKKIYNYKHSRAPRVIENALGILITRWRIFYKPIKSTLENAENYTVACLALHNYLKQTDNAVYRPVGFADSESRDGAIKECKWRSMKGDDENAFKSINLVRGSR